MHDLVIKGGSVVDGTGAPARTADVAITDGVITEVGAVAGKARETVDADGALVTPGFVDVHTHFDGQVTWDPMLTPTCWHGVTTIVMGNCGVGFAPVKPDKHAWLIGLMEGVEDIPGAAFSEGIQWGWEHYPEYLDAVDRAPKMLDVGAQVPHGAVRGYVMGERGAKNEPATPDDIEAMARIVREGIEAGALGFSTSRTIAHMAIDGEPVPGTFAAEDELFGIGRVLGELGTGVFELAPAGALGEDLAAPEREMAWMRKLSAAIKRPVTFALTQNDHDPESWRLMLDLCAQAVAEGAQVRPQVAGRPVSLLLGLQTFHPFAYCPSWAPIGARDAGGEGRGDARSRAAGEAARRGRRRDRADAPVPRSRARVPDGCGARLRAVARAQRRRDSPARRTGREMEVFYDALLADDGLGLVLRPLLNYTDFSLDAVREMLLHPSSAWGLGDGGAHCGTTCDASTPTYMLAHWARDRAHDRLPLEWIVKKMTADTASLYGLGDRGVLQPGKIGDVNVIDFDHVQLETPVMVHDLPGRRPPFRAAGARLRHHREVGRGHLVRRRRPGRAPRPAAARRALKLDSRASRSSASGTPRRRR